MSDFKSARELAMAKRRHKCDFTWSGTGGGSSQPAQSPAPAVAATPAVQQKSCKEFNIAKVEHLTTIASQHDNVSQKRASPHHADKCHSQEAFSISKRRHGHELDSCSARRHREAQINGAEAPSPSKCMSAEKFKADKALHRHAMDSHRDGIAADAAEASGKCVSVERLGRDKSLHKHLMDSCRDNGAEDVAEVPRTDDKSQRILARDKKQHRKSMEAPTPVKAEEPTDDSVQRASRQKLAKEIKRHEYSIQRAAPTIPSDPYNNKSSSHLRKAKASHKATLSSGAAVASRPTCCVSNEEYSRIKSKHSHYTNECRGDVSVRNARGGYSAADDKKSMVSATELNEKKKKHSHVMDEGKEVPQAAAADEAASEQCLSQRKMAVSKRAHGHDLDSWSPKRERDGGADADAEGLTSQRTLDRSKRHHRHAMDDWRSPARSAAEGAETPATSAAASPDNTKSQVYLASEKRQHRFELDSPVRQRPVPEPAAEPEPAEE